MIEIKEEKKEVIWKKDFVFYERFIKSVGMRYVEYIVKAITREEMLIELDYWVSNAMKKNCEEIITSECCTEIIRTCSSVLKDMTKKEVLIIK